MVTHDPKTLRHCANGTYARHILTAASSASTVGFLRPKWPKRPKNNKKVRSEKYGGVGGV